MRESALAEGQVAFGIAQSGGELQAGRGRADLHVVRDGEVTEVLDGGIHPNQTDFFDNFPDDWYPDGKQGFLQDTATSFEAAQTRIAALASVYLVSLDGPEQTAAEGQVIELLLLMTGQEVDSNSRTNCEELARKIKEEVWGNYFAKLMEKTGTVNIGAVFPAVQQALDATILLQNPPVDEAVEQTDQIILEPTGTEEAADSEEAAGTSDAKAKVRVPEGPPGERKIDPRDPHVRRARETTMRYVIQRLLGEEADGQSWQTRALCAQVDPDTWFPEKGGSTREAKKVCSSCEVRGECLDQALENGERHGIWGGLSEGERRRLKKGAV